MMRFRLTLGCILLIFEHASPLSLKTSHKINSPSSPNAGDKHWLPEDWTSALSDIPKEVQHDERMSLPLKGTIPHGLHGIMYKAGPAKFGFDGTNYAHWLEGDGAVIRLELDDITQTATFASSLVQTESLVSSREAGYITTRGTFGTMKTRGVNAFDTKLKNPANTNAVRLGDRVMAFSDVGLPYAMDPDTLETRGEETFDGKLRSGNAAATTGIDVVDRLLSFGDSVSPHYRIVARDDGDEASNNQYLVMAALKQGALSGDTEVRLMEFDRITGVCVADATSAQLKGTGFPPHDWICSDKHAIWITTPATGNLLPYIMGIRGPAECLSLSTDMPASMHLLRRQGGKRTSPQVQRIDLPRPIHPIHFGNAWETTTEDGGGGVEVIACCWDTDTIQSMAKNGESMLGNWADVAGGDFTDVSSQVIMRISLQGDESSVTIKSLLPNVIGHFDYIKCHPRFNGFKSRYVWGITSTLQPDKPSPVSPPQTICCVDLEQEELVDSWYAGRRRFLDDFVAVPKEDGGCEELDAWLVAPCYDASTNTTSFVILDGSDLRAGPVAEAHLDHHVPWALHGHWHAL